MSRLKPYYAIDYMEKGMWLRIEATTSNCKAYRIYEELNEQHKRLVSIDGFGKVVLKVN